MQEAYIVAGFRTAVTKSKKGGFRFMRSDELAIEVIKGLMKKWLEKVFLTSCRELVVLR
jgi:acetyl-CoA acetyltransferase